MEYPLPLLPFLSCMHRFWLTKLLINIIIISLKEEKKIKYCIGHKCKMVVLNFLALYITKGY